MAQRQFIVNTIATILNLLVQLSISFLLTSYLVNSIGATAYGFFCMANTLVNYALIMSNALNSMAARFIGYEIHNGNYEKAKSYYSSVFIGDFLFALTILLPSLFVIGRLDRIINIPADLVGEVKLLFLIIFFNMCCNVVSAVFGCVYIVKNRLDLQSVVTIISNVVKALLLIYLYVSYKPSIVFLGVATLIATIIISFGNIYCTKRFLPRLSISVAFVKLQSIKDVVFSGVWNSINQLSVTLLHGLDLLLANLMVCAEAMGVLSLAGTLPGVISMCINSLANIFTPNLLEYFSKKKYDELLHEMRNSIRFMTVVSCIPISFLIGFGKPFFELWTPNTDIQMLYILSIIVMLPQFSGGAISSMNYLYTVANKVKWQSIVLFITGVINVPVVYCLLKFTDIGVYAVVGVSAAIAFIRNFLFNAPYAAHCIKQKYFVFWLDMLKSLAALLATSFIGFVICNYINPQSWFSLICVGGGYTIVSGFLITFLFLSKSQRVLIFQKLKR